MKWFLALLVVATGMLISRAGEAADRSGPIRIAALTDAWGPTPAVLGLREGLQELGYLEYEHFVIGVRFTQGDIAAFPAAARELVQHGVDLIFTSDESAAKAAQMATTRIPIVFTGVGDPLGSGLVKSFARPGGNIAGVTDRALELGPKRLELFREIIPGLKRVLFPYNLADAYAVAEAGGYREAAQRLGIVLVEKAVRTEEEAQATLARVSNAEVDGILKPRFHSLNIPGFILEAATQRAIPTMFTGPFWVERGGLAGYGPDNYESGRQAARLIDKILKGGEPAEIPVEVNVRTEFVVNLKVANALRLTIAPEVLHQANRVIR